MKVIEIYNMQKDLDSTIIENKNLNIDDDTLTYKRLLALFVEVGEFQYALMQQQYCEKMYNAKCSSCCMMPHYMVGHDCNREKTLEEYVDCMHFIFSIANALELDAYLDSDMEFTSDYYYRETPFIISLSEFANYLSNWKYWKAPKIQDKEMLCIEWMKVLDSYIAMGIETGFNIEEIENAYKTKMQTNYARQEANY